MPSKKVRAKQAKAEKAARAAQAEAERAAREEAERRFKETAVNKDITKYGAGENWIHKWRPPHLDPRDNVEAAVPWLLKRKVDSKGLAKYLPHTAQNIYDGTVDSKLVQRSLCSYFGENFNEACRGLGNHLSCVFLPPKAILEKQGLWLGCNKRDYGVLRKELYGCMVLKVAGCYHQYRESYNKDPEAADLNLEADIWNSLKDMKGEWAERIDSTLFQGTPGTFVRNCPVLQHPEMIKDILRTELSDKTSKANSFAEFYQIRKGMGEAISGIKAGRHNFQTTCWECGQTGEFSCTGCPAVYCSSECNVKAWGEGHKEMCPIVKQKYQLFEKSLVQIDAARNEDGSSPYRIPVELEHALAYSTLFCEIHPVPQESTWPLQNHLVGPDLAVFQQNWGRISRGEWWVFSEPDSQEDYDRELKCDEDNYFKVINERLLYDFFGLANNSSITVANYCEEVANEDLRFAEEMKEHFGALMPPEHFMNHYKKEFKFDFKYRPCVYKLDDSPVSESYLSQLRRQYRERMIEFLRKIYHK